MDKRRLCKIDSNFTSGIIETYYVNEVRESKSPIPVDVLILDFPKKGNQYLALPMSGFFLCKYYDLDYNFFIFITCRTIFILSKKVDVSTDEVLRCLLVRKVSFFSF